MKKLFSVLISIIFILCIIAPDGISAEIVLSEYIGDLDNDMTVSSADVKIMSDYMFRKNSYDALYKMDLNEDQEINIADLILLKSCANGETEIKPIYEDDGFLDQVTKVIKKPLPSHGNVNIPVFFIDFPDCRFSRNYSCAELNDEMFGASDEKSYDYPFESISAFYERSSKGAIKLSGNTYRYTAQNNIEYYADDIFKTELVSECLIAFNDIIDLSKYDNDHNGNIDTIVFNVPHTADDEYWWPSTINCEGYIPDFDGLEINRIVVGNAPVQNISLFNSTYAHELGHCMELPDYYLYYGDDSEGMHGPAGSELMDTDASSDLSAVSKLMLGWYKNGQAEVFDYTDNEVTYTLYNAQSDQGNCVIIPKITPFNSSSEFFIIEYQTEDANNSGFQRLWWEYFSTGIRIYHADTELSFYGDYFFSYEFSFREIEKRFIRLVNDGEPAFTQNSFIDRSVPGFGWYDQNEEESIDPGVTIHINSINENECSVTISLS